jgi:hypothetical protein
VKAPTAERVRLLYSRFRNPEEAIRGKETDGRNILRIVVEGELRNSFPTVNGTHLRNRRTGTDQNAIEIHCYFDLYALAELTRT